jgi:hypothetical protein
MKALVARPGNVWPSLRWDWALELAVCCIAARGLRPQDLHVAGLALVEPAITAQPPRPPQQSPTGRRPRPLRRGVRYRCTPWW